MLFNYFTVQRLSYVVYGRVNIYIYMLGILCVITINITRCKPFNSLRGVRAFSCQ